MTIPRRQFRIRPLTSPFFQFAICHSVFISCVQIVNLQQINEQNFLVFVICSTTFSISYFFLFLFFFFFKLVPYFYLYFAAFKINVVYNHVQFIFHALALTVYIHHYLTEKPKREERRQKKNNALGKRTNDELASITEDKTEKENKRSLIYQKKLAFLLSVSFIQFFSCKLLLRFADV